MRRHGDHPRQVGVCSGVSHHSANRDHRRPVAVDRSGRDGCTHGDAGIGALHDYRGRQCRRHPGVRVFTATSSQGLLYGMEMVYTVAGWRAPFVMVNVSRGLSSPITLESDHNDIMAARDSGFLQIHCATCQEITDSVLMAYRLAEHKHVRLPAIVNQDGFYLSFTREPVTLPDAEKAAAFVGAFDPENMQFKSGAPLSQAMAVLGGGPYSYFRYEAHLAAAACFVGLR